MKRRLRVVDVLDRRGKAAGLSPPYGRKVGRCAGRRSFCTSSCTPRCDGL